MNVAHRTCAYHTGTVCAWRTPIQSNRTKTASNKAPTNASISKSPIPKVDFAKNAMVAMENDTVMSGKISRHVKNGYVVNFDGFFGFLPYNLLGKRMKDAQAAEADRLVGEAVAVKVSKVEPAVVEGQNPRILLSQLDAIRQLVLSKMKLDDVIRCKVLSVEDFGALVVMNGQPDLVGMLHNSEVSWTPVLNINTVVSVGDVMEAKVIKILPEKGQFNVSLKRLQEDPLMTSLSTVDWQPVTASVLMPEISKLLRMLRQQPGITDVVISRQAIEKQHASQDVEIYLTKEEIPHEFQLVLRTGSLLYEVKVVTDISREAMRATMTTSRATI